jgi:uncharacterized Ntn-hydrolase superfamily protein
MSLRARRWLVRSAAAALVLAAAAGQARATYSVVAADGARGQVGGAGTSCVGRLSVRIIYRGVPGVGALHAQAQVGGPGAAEAARLLAAGVAPADVIAAITAPAFDPDAAARQYGVVDLVARAAGYTGARTLAFAADRQGQVDAFTYAVQGNILTSAAVLDQAEAGFRASGCDLVDRLLRALEAGAERGEGDSRCTPAGIPSDSAFIEVDRAGEPAGDYLRLEAIDTAPASPLVSLRAQYDAWRATHPCPAPPTDAGVDPATDFGGCCQGARAPAPAGAVLALVVVLLVARRPRPGRAAGARGHRRPSSR